jgi:hypothetical protein
MFREDVIALRSWLEQAYPTGWAERTAPDQGDHLAVADVLLVALFTGVGEEFGKAMVGAVKAKLKEIADRYTADELPTDEVQFETVPETDTGNGNGTIVVPAPETLELVEVSGRFPATESSGAGDDAD